MSILSGTATGLNGLEISENSLKLANFSLDEIDPFSHKTTIAHSNDCIWYIKYNYEKDIYTTVVQIEELDFYFYDKNTGKIVARSERYFYNTKHEFVLYFNTIGDLIKMLPFFKKRYDKNSSTREIWNLFYDCLKGINYKQNL